MGISGLGFVWTSSSWDLGFRVAGSVLAMSSNWLDLFKAPVAGLKTPGLGAWFPRQGGWTSVNSSLGDFREFWGLGGTGANCMIMNDY